MNLARPQRTLLARAAVHAALGEPARLAIVDELASSDRSPKELGEHLGILSNLLSHHLDVLEQVGIVARFSSAGDGRRKYVRLVRGHLTFLPIVGRLPQGDLLFLCSRNSARSQLAASLWMARTGRPASSLLPAPDMNWSMFLGFCPLVDLPPSSLL